MTTTTRMVSFGYDPDTVVIRLSPLTPFLSTGIALWGRLAQAHAKVAELADAPDLGSGSRKALGVRLPPFALLRSPEIARASACTHQQAKEPAEAAPKRAPKRAP